MINIQEIYHILSSQKFVLDNEKSIQLQIENVFISQNIEYKREFSLNDDDIIDFLVGDLGIEIKLKYSKRRTYKQCERYLNSDIIKSLLLISATSMGLPNNVSGKPIYYLSLTKAWL